MNKFDFGKLAIGLIFGGVICSIPKLVFHASPEFSLLWNIGIAMACGGYILWMALFTKGDQI